MSQISISVRFLVEFVLRAGNLTRGFAGRSRALEGTRGHKRLQKSRPDDYEAEVPVSFSVERDGLEIDITGRMDGLTRSDDRPLIEEIKTITGEFDSSRPDNPMHWAQAKVYAAIVTRQQEFPQADIKLTYVRLDPWEVHEDTRTYSREGLAAFFDDLLVLFLKWRRVYFDWAAQRNTTIDTLDFPFAEYRQGQRRLVVAAYRAIELECRLFAQAPTGIGKTISVLFPAIKALKEGHAEKIFYLTAKTIGRTVVEKALDDMRRKGLSIKSVTLTARDKICFNTHGLATCDPDQCEYAIGYFDRINDAVTETFAHHHAMTRSFIEDQANKHKVCPFEFSLDLSLWADVIICDYNYVFDPRAYLRRFFLDQTGRYLFLIDEAHNLVDRAREMFSASLSKRMFLDLRRHLKPHAPAIAKRSGAVNSALLTYQKRCREEAKNNTWVSTDLPEDVLKPLHKLVDAAEEVLAQNRPLPHRDELLECYFEALAFLRIAELFDGRYITYAEKFRKDVTLRLFCLDPSYLLHEGLQRSTASIFFSATLTPLDYFREILGGEEDDPMIYLDSPFPSENFRLLVADHIGTSYKQRDQTYDTVAYAVASLVQGMQGNYLVFFPSYRYMQSVYEQINTLYPDLNVHLQTSGMTETEREDYLALFDTDTVGTLIGFAVMGGLFGEGIDLVGDRLVGAAVVGVGLPQICLERELIRDYFAAREADGFAYAYMFPGMNRVLQAAGRVIRTPEDRGAVLLIDQRFGHRRYRRLFPAWWHPVQQVRRSEEIEEAVKAFWNLKN